MAAEASLGLTVASLIQGGKAEKRNLQAQARGEEFNARTRQIERKQNLIMALSLQKVKAGASGVAGGAGSSTAAIAREDIRKSSFDSAIDAGVTSQRTTQLRANARNAQTLSLLSAGAEVGRYSSRKSRRGSSKATKSSTPLHDQTSDLGW